MTQTENQQLIELLNAKKAEIKMAMEYVKDHCTDEEQEEYETRDLQRMLRHTQQVIIAMTADFGAQETIDHVNEDKQMLVKENQENSFV